MSDMSWIANPYAAWKENAENYGNMTESITGF